MEVTKEKSEFGHYITMIEGSKRFQLLFAGNLDLYWRIENLGAKSELRYEDFLITKENYYIYDAFDTLYESVKNCKVYTEDDNSFIKKSPLYDEELQKRMQERLKIIQRKLFIDNSIIWYSDDGDYEYDEIVRISKIEESFLVEFFKVDKLDKDKHNYLSYRHLGITVRFRNSGCRYAPFEMPFMTMYNHLCKYEPEVHQMHMEEYVYSLKKKDCKK